MPKPRNTDPAKCLPVDKGIPIPPKSVHRGYRKFPARKYPWNIMEVGDSFMVECGPVDKLYVMSGLLQNARQATMRWGRKFTARTVQTGVRIWRIE